MNYGRDRHLASHTRTTSFIITGTGIGTGALVRSLIMEPTSLTLQDGAFRSNIPQKSILRVDDISFKMIGKHPIHKLHPLILRVEGPLPGKEEAAINAA